jgi:type II secretory pathway pseudopilin PulG
MVGRGGFTLLEALVAVVLIAGGVAAVMWAFGAGIAATTDVEDTAAALDIAQAKMEEIKNTSFANLADSGPTADPNFPRFSVTVNVAEGQNPMQVDVTVAWGVIKGGQTSTSLTTLVADYAAT